MLFLNEILFDTFLKTGTLIIKSDRLGYYASKNWNQ